MTMSTALGQPDLPVEQSGVVEDEENFERSASVDSFSIPNKDFSTIFKDYNSWLNAVRPRIRMSESTHPLSFTDQVVDISLLDDVLTGVPKGYRFLHIGAIQVGLIPLFSFKKNIAACVALMDARFTEDLNAITGMVGARLNAGPVWIDHHPGYCLSLLDKHLKSALKLKIRLHGLGTFKRGAEFLSVCVRLYIKYSNSATSKVVYRDDEVILNSLKVSSDGTIHTLESDLKDHLLDPDFWKLSRSNTRIVNKSINTAPTTFAGYVTNSERENVPYQSM